MWKNIKKLFRILKPCQAFGDLIIGYGVHEIFIKTGCQPLNVFICLKDCSHHQICHGGINLAATRPTKHGFILYTDIKTELCEIEWLAEY